ncbi:MAG: hypothetical protein M9932_04230 [Xanthobacteraceae bacterium]|nr:hypothetical protein [Xanthobacteraceae bacterium]
MTPEPFIVTMEVPLINGRRVSVEFDASKPVDIAPLLKMNGARMAQRPAPLFLKPLKENGAGAPLLHSAPASSQEWRKPSPSRGVSWQKSKPEKSLIDDLRECREVMAEKASELALMDSRLAPARVKEQEIREAIVATHDRRDGVIVLNLGRRGERSPLFTRLDAISKKWGPLKSQRKDLHGEIKTLERQIDHIQRAIERANRKKAKG